MFGWIVLAVIIILIIIAAANSKSNKQSQEFEDLKSSWGRLQNKKYPKDDYENISHYSKLRKEEGFYIDEITWNDLEMDKIFQAMDCARSSIGREYIYTTLRMPEDDSLKLSEVDGTARWMAENTKNREHTQSLLSRLGFVHNFSFSDYIDTIQGLSPIGSGISVFLDILLAIFVVITFVVNAPVGVICIIAVILTATGIYFKKKPEIEPYFICLSQVSRMVRCGRIFINDTDNFADAPEALKNRLRKMKRYVKTLEPCTKGDWLIADSRSSGSPGEVFMNYIRMFTHVDIIHYNKAIKQMQGRKTEIMNLMDEFGFIETAIAVASFRTAIVRWSVPEFRDSKDISVDIINVYHPLLDDAVANSISVPTDGENNVLLTGSNASGKSTFLKSVAINAILSQSIMTSVSDKYAGPFFRIMSSMSLRDDLENAGSYYMVEIKSLKRILDAASDEGVPVLCFIDEVLRGTNTVERIAASSSILKYAGGKNAVVFAATHDIELTVLLKDDFANYHFREDVTSDGIEFSYKIFDGHATTKNAIALLDNLGYDKEIIESAKKRADEFVDTGIWR